MGNGSPAARRQLGALLKQLREDSGKTAQSVGEAKVAGATKLWRIETGKNLPSVSDVLGLCWLYGADTPTTQRLTDIVIELSQSNGGWWEAYGKAVPAWLSLYVGMEQSAYQISIYEPELVHGLLQTPAYALAANHEETAEEAVRNAELRMARQKAVDERTDQYAISIVLGQAALERLVGGPDVMKDQIQHLREVGKKSRIAVRILGWEVGVHAALSGGPFRLFQFHSPEEGPVVYIPLLSGGRYIEKTADTQLYQSTFDSLWQQATPIEEYSG